jgi:hypothetical protein
VDPGAGHHDSFCDRTQLLKYRPMGMAGLIAGADIVFGGRTHTDCLSRAAVLAAGPEDQVACKDAAVAAECICQLMARDDDDRCLR